MSNTALAALRSLGLVAVALAAAACSGGDDGGSGSTTQSLADTCSSLCAKTGPLSCPNQTADCSNQCQSTRDAIPKCASQYDALMTCSNNQPASSYACNADGKAELTTAACDAEFNAYGSCLMAG